MAVFSKEKSPNSTGATQKNTEKQTHIPDASSIKVFMNQVANLVELVDTRYIVELHLKQLDYEVAIRKKDAMQPVPAPAPAYMMQAPSYGALPSPPPPVQSATPAPSLAASAPASAPAAPSTKPSTSSHHALKSPMSGTFYRSPALGAPPFCEGWRQGSKRPSSLHH